MTTKKLSGERTTNYYAGAYKGNVYIRKPNIATHPTWDGWVKEWIFLINAFEGGQDFLRDNYLFKHERESNKAYGGRKHRAYYLNYVKLVIKLWSTYMKKSPPKRNIDHLDFDNFIKNIDLKNNDIDEFWLGRVFSLMQAVGMVHIILADYIPENVDVGVIRTMLDQQQAGISDRLIVKLPQEMINWRKHVDGSYKWCVFQNIGIVKLNWDTKVNVNYNKQEISYTVYTESEEIQLDEAGREQRRFSHNLGFVPVVTAMSRLSEQWIDLGLADMHDVAVINREVYNISSLIQEFLYKQCFNFLAGPDDLLTDDEGTVNLGTGGVLPYTQGTPPMYVSPPIDPAHFLQTERDKLIQEMYRHSIIRDKSIEKDDPASGISKAYDVHETTQSLSEKVNALQDAENKIIDMFQKKHGIKNNTKKGEKIVEYPKDYDIISINDDLEVITSVFNLDLSETLNQLKAKNIARKLIPNASESEFKKINKEIESGNPAENSLFAKMESMEDKNKDKDKDKDKDKGKKDKSQTGVEITQDHNKQ